MRQLTALIVIVMIHGCAATAAPPVTLASGADSLRIFQNDELPSECQEIATVEVTHGEGCGGNGKVGNRDGAFNSFRNEVVAKGGNAAVIQSEVPPHAMPFCYMQEFKMRGFGFTCPNQPVQ